MGATTAITDTSFEAEVLQSPILTIVDFWADWCAPCKRLTPVLEQLAREYAGRIKVTKLDVDTSPQTPEYYNVSGIPTLLVFKQGQILDAITGFLPKDRLIARLTPYL